MYLSTTNVDIFPDEIKEFVFDCKIIMETQRIAFGYESAVVSPDKETATEIALGRIMLYEMNHKNRYLRINEINVEARYK